MKTKQFVDIEKRLLHNLEGFAIKGHLLIITPVEHTLRGFHFDGSAFDKTSFCVTAFFMPMYVPHKHLHITFGNRVRSKSGERWNAEDQGFEAALESAVHREVPSLVAMKTPRDVARALEPFTKHHNPHSHEAFAYSLIQAGDIPRALRAIDKLQSLIDPLRRGSQNLTWELEIATRAQIVKAKCLAGPDDARAQLDVWESETVHNLGLKDVWCPRQERLS